MLVSVVQPPEPGERLGVESGVNGLLLADVDDGKCIVDAVVVNEGEREWLGVALE